ncbi:MAG: hypothetical protein ILA52_00915, partial [Alphaproteobacteria bacterium]|nr:hypothetical protein [Alphaproteobacteria bacterium]
NLFYLSVLVLTAGLTACASNDDNTRNYRYANRPGCSTPNCQAAAPAPAPVYQPAPVAQNCGGCPAREYTVRTPVQVVYKNTTYRTVYEPRTTETSAYETRPYNRAEVCSDGNCGTPQLVSRQPM